MPPRPNPIQLSALNRARLALYGTIGLCGLTYSQTYTAQATLSLAAQQNNRERWKEGLKLKAKIEERYVCSRKNIREGRYYTLVTSIWNHGSGIHFLGNMLGLWSFGQTIAYTFGARTFMTIFYGGALVGNLLCLGLDKRFGADAKDPLSKDARQKRETGGFVGASGGVCALTAANACLNPWGSMIIGIMFIPVPVPNVVGALGFAGFSAWAQGNDFQSNVAHLGHLGGLVYGFVWFVARYRGMPAL